VYTQSVMELSNEIETIRAEDVACCKEEFERKGMLIFSWLSYGKLIDVGTNSTSSTRSNTRCHRQGYFVFPGFYHK
jgi:hypothetical protein